MNISISAIDTHIKIGLNVMGLINGFLGKLFMNYVSFFCCITILKAQKLDFGGLFEIIWGVLKGFAGIS